VQYYGAGQAAAELSNLKGGVAPSVNDGIGVSCIGFAPFFGGCSGRASSVASFPSNFTVAGLGARYAILGPLHTMHSAFIKHPPSIRPLRGGVEPPEPLQDPGRSI
jgi:hypothetical protein